jgi:hypothetical protein
MSPDNTVKKQAGRFQKGKSGNPNGRPKGSRNATTVFCEAMLSGEAEEIMRKAIQMGKRGHPIAMRWCLDRIMPPAKDRPVTFQLRPINSARDAADALSDVAAAVSSGTITPSDAEAISRVLGNAAKAYEIADAGNDAELIQQYSDAALYRIIARERAAKRSEQLPSLLTPRICEVES